MDIDGKKLRVGFQDLTIEIKDVGIIPLEEEEEIAEDDEVVEDEEIIKTRKRKYKWFAAMRIGTLNTSKDV